jgi:NhaD family Na+/H+ antiporter
MRFFRYLVAAGIVFALAPCTTLAADFGSTLDLTDRWTGFVALFVFVAAYAVVVIEEFTQLRKSKPVMLAAGIIWAIIAYQYSSSSMPQVAEEAVDDFLIEFAQLFLFLLAAMTYVNAMSERRIFDALRSWLVSRGFGYRQLFWVTGTISFFLSPFIDNLTTSLVMCAVVLAVGKDSPRFVSISCVNIVVAANAGGAFSPFGDITTLMVWQRGLVDFQSFFALFIPSAVNYLVPATIMTWAIPANRPDIVDDGVSMKRGARTIVFLFGCTVATAVSFRSLLHLPPFMGMMTGLAFLKLFGYYLRRTHIPMRSEKGDYGEVGDVRAFDSYREVARAEWDTLLFFFGVIMCVGGLSFIGYLELVALYAYGELGPTLANTSVGIVSAVVDNIPVMVAVLQMHPEMDLLQWLLVTLTAGVGGSLLSVGSAAGVALMGQARGVYTFFSHLKWTPAIALGYALSIWVHLIVNHRLEGILPG